MTTMKRKRSRSNGTSNRSKEKQRSRFLSDAELMKLCQTLAANEGATMEKAKEVLPGVADIPFLNQQEVADLLGIANRTLERFRYEGRGPPFRKFGRRVLYSLPDVMAWADGQRRTSTHEAEPHRAR